MSYFNHLKYQDMAKDLDTFFKEKKELLILTLFIKNVVVIHYKRLIKNIKLLIVKILKIIRKKMKKKHFLQFFADRDDLWVKRNLMMKHFKENV